MRFEHPARSRLAAYRQRPHDERGMTLVEMLVVLVIMPLVIGALALAIVTGLKDSGGVGSRISESSDAALTSEFYVRDVESAAYLTTNQNASPAPCGSGTTFELGLSWVTPSVVGTQVSYWLTTTGSGASPLYELERFYCSGGTVSTPQVLLTTVSLPSTITVSIYPATLAAKAAAGWTSTAGVSSVVVAGVLQSTTAGLPDPASVYHFDLSATPRVSTPISQGVNPGGSPPT